MQQMLVISVIFCLCYFLQLFGGADSSSGMLDLELHCENVYRSYGYYYYYYDNYYHDYYYDEVRLESEDLIKYYVDKILSDDDDNKVIASLEEIFTDDFEQEIEITYDLNVPCKNSAIKTKFFYSEHQAFPGILKGMEGKTRKETVKIEMTKEEGFGDSCEELFCETGSRQLTEDELKTIFCRVTNQVTIHVHITHCIF